ncbi:MAG: HAMP domain-containing protein, partial [Blastocatellia bacterium]|nr:HAMP domain-containing protein [Blastocatellia bacterium]
VVEKGKTPKPVRSSPWILGGVVFVLLLLLILLQSSNLWKTFTVQTASDTLLLYALSSLNFIAFVIFGFIFLRSIIKLMRERRAFQLGSKIKTRLLIYFAAVSLLPIVAMAGFSYLFMNRALERWFTQIPENVVREAREVQTRSLADQAARVDQSAAMLAQALDGREVTSEELNSIAAAGKFARIEVISLAGEVSAVGEGDSPAANRGRIENKAAQARRGETQATPNSELAYRSSVAQMSDGRRVILVPELAGEGSVSHMVDKSLEEFDRLKDQQTTVRQIAMLTLGVLTFLLIFASSWIAFYIARGLTVPLKALAEGADEIAQGNLSHRVDVLAEDELELLVNTFNQMSAKLEANAEELNARRMYVETLLQALPTGIVSFDADNRISTINTAAAKILRLDDVDFTGLELSGIVSNDNSLIIERLIARAKRIGHASEQTVLVADGGSRHGDIDGQLPVALTAAALADAGGSVLVIEDLSELIAAQRASAWQEVARRMAHEIKNPLTPIQLSAERIAKRFANASNGANGAVHVFQTDDQTERVIQDGTATILREVRSLKSMVDEFSRFARLPDARLEAGDVSEIVRGVLALYEDRHDGVLITSDLSHSLPVTKIDAEQLKRVFVNLIDNAIEAFDPDATEKRLHVSTRHDAARDIVVAEVADNGRGISPANLQKLFQPYFSTKGRGTGLGLAIVHRIIGEHHGKIKAVANQPHGAMFIIELPVAP